MEQEQIVPVILCGGAGTRLWPLSSCERPKQFLELDGEGTLFQATLRRACMLAPGVAPMVVANRAHRPLLRRELRLAGLPDAELLLEPVGRNTAPALAAAAFRLCRRAPSTLMLALPSDHHVRDPARLVATVRASAAAAREGAIVLFGVVPTEPHTGYGYIRKGGRVEFEATYRVAQFEEKPDLRRARGYLAGGEHLWNSGMFLMRADVFLRELACCAPDIHAAAGAAVRGGRRSGAALALEAAAFSACPSESVDRAVMERTSVGLVAELAVGWSDLGTWPSLFAALGTRRERQDWGWQRACAGPAPIALLHLRPRTSLALDGAAAGAEHWIVVRGQALVVCGRRRHALACGESIEIPAGRRRTLQNSAAVPLELVRVRRAASRAPRSAPRAAAAPAAPA